MRAHLIVFSATILAAVACGARSDLEVPRERPGPIDAGSDVIDAGPDVINAAPDAPDDEPDAAEVPDCADAGVTYIYLVTSENVLYRFNPTDLALSKIGLLECSDPAGGEPYSMAVDRKGIAYVLFSSGNVFRVSTATASCKATKYVQQSGDFFNFGMGFSADVTDPGEHLYLASTSAPEKLATLDPTTFKLSVVGTFSKDVGSVELTGTADGKLYGFGVAPPSIHLAEIDKGTAKVLSDTLVTLPTGDDIASWAFAYYGGDFYFFTASAGAHSHVARYHLGDHPAVAHEITDVDNTVVGAGVSTCAPRE